jgi:hypothetical protein
MKKPRQLQSDEAISILVKNKLCEMLAKTKDPNTAVALTNAWAKLRSVELKQEQGEFGDSLPDAEEVKPFDLGGEVRQ